MGAWTTATVQSDQPLNNAPLLRSPTKTTNDERLKVATNDLFELLERVQCSRLDDQRCVLPAYFLQVRRSQSINSHFKRSNYCSRFTLTVFQYSPDYSTQSEQKKNVNSKKNELNSVKSRKKIQGKTEIHL